MFSSLQDSDEKKNPIKLTITICFIAFLAHPPDLVFVFPQVGAVADVLRVLLLIASLSGDKNELELAGKK